MSAATIEGNAATITGHDKRLTRLEEFQEQMLVRFDRLTLLLVTTLATAVTTLVFMLLKR